MELDDKNKIIFENLLADGRCSVKNLAKILKVSKATIIKRIKFLESERYISRYDAIIDWQKIPLRKKVYFVKRGKARGNFEKRILNNKSVFSLIRLSGLYNYQIWCFFKTKSQEKIFEKHLDKDNYEFIEVNKLTFPKTSFFNVINKLPLKKLEKGNIRIGKIDVDIMKYMANGHGRDSLYSISETLKIPYDSVHYHAKNLMKQGYFSKIIAQPGTNKFTLQTTSLLIKCNSDKDSEALYTSLKNVSKIVSKSIGKNNKIMLHFFSQTHLEYRNTLEEIFSLISREDIKSAIISHWNKVLLNNRYPLEYLL